ncbi:MAG: YceI family protein [Balneolaceae bacterium]|nr:YceI family protein [Balneolaceae bacterium]
MTTQTKTLWKIDPSHSEIQFKARHLVISTVTGSFNSFDARVETDDDTFEGADIFFEADVDSVNTNNEDRDTHLKSDDFFNAEKFPKLTFASNSLEKVGENAYKLTGDLTIRDVTKPVTLDVVHGGTVEDPYGQVKAGFEVNGTINRKEFGLKWNGITEAGNLVVGDEIQLLLNVQFVQQD